MFVEIRQIDPFGHRDAVFRVYCESLGLDPCSTAALEWRDTILPRHATRADFDFRAAVASDDEIVGFVYGYTGAYRQWWTDRVAADMSEEARRVWLDPPHFESFNSTSFRAPSAPGLAPSCSTPSCNISPTIGRCCLWIR